jgi:hypothetical protein
MSGICQMIHYSRNLYASDATRPAPRLLAQPHPCQELLSLKRKTVDDTNEDGWKIEDYKTISLALPETASSYGDLQPGSRY